MPNGVAAPHMIVLSAPSVIACGRSARGNDAEDFVNELRSMRGDAARGAEHERPQFRDRRAHHPA